jgi:hypothetical protein
LPKSHVPVVVCRSAAIPDKRPENRRKENRQPEANRRTPSLRGIAT